MPHLGLGGSQKQAVHLHRLLQDRGFEPVLVATDVSSRYENNLFPSVPLKVARRYVTARALIAGFSMILVESLRKNRSHWRLKRNPWSTKYSWLKQHLIGRADSEQLEILERLGIGTTLSALGLRRLFLKLGPSLIISFLPKTNILSIVAAQGIAPVWVSERNDPCRQLLDPRVTALRTELYPIAEKILANSRHAVADLREMFPASNCYWMPNIMDHREPVARPMVSSRIIGYVGRLHSQKRVDHLILGFEKSALWEGADGFHLQIVGSGPEERTLRDIANRTSCAEKISFLGLQSFGKTSLRQMAFCVLPSLHEGHPNVMDESISSGTIPLVSRDIQEMQFIFSDAEVEEIGFSETDQLADKLRSLAKLPPEKFLDLFERVSGSFSRDLTRREERIKLFLESVSRRVSRIES